MPIVSNRPRFIGSVEDEWQLYSDRAEDYTIGAPIGYGASSIVYAAEFHPASSDGSTQSPEPCALKVLDLDRLPPHSLSLLQRETTLMSLSKHPNVLRVRGSWMDGHKLYIALRLMNKGSAADVMRYGWPGGMEEDVVRCILRQALQGLNYLHINGFIHRDIKAANLLIDDDGTVLLGDLGVAADLSEDTSDNHPKHRHVRTTTAILAATHSTTSSGHSNPSKRVHIIDSNVQPRIGKRKSFVGTPCWMAPELIQGHQYDSAADIWSFGITALELTQGRPPRSRESPSKVLLKTVQDAPPTLNREGGTHKYSKAFKEMIESCLMKDPTKRPTAEQLLQTPFFKGSKKKSYLVSAILNDLPPLAKRQERRPIASVFSHHTVDSWDFAATIGSPTISSRRVHGSIERNDVRRSRTSDMVQEAVFEMDGEPSSRRSSFFGGEETWSRASIRDDTGHSRHQRNISWAEQDDFDEQKETSAIPIQYAQRSEQAEQLASSSISSTADDAESNSSPPTSDSEAPQYPAKATTLRATEKSRSRLDQSLASSGHTTPASPPSPAPPPSLPHPASAPAVSALGGTPSLNKERRSGRRSCSSSPPPSKKRPDNSLWRKITRRYSKSNGLSDDYTAVRGRSRMSTLLSRKPTAGKDA